MNEAQMMVRPRYEQGFTGLEAAIVLIAFIVVAAFFSYMVLGAGFFTTQTAQTTVKGGVDQAGAGLVVVGNVYGVKDTTNNYLDYVNVTVRNTAGGSESDFAGMVISYNDNNGGHNASLDYGGINTGCPTSQASSFAWCVVYDSGNDWIIMAGLPDTATPGTRFTLNFQPQSGAVTPLTRTIPGEIHPVQDLS